MSDILARLVAFLLVTHWAAAIGCIGLDGSAADWWFIYKMPENGCTGAGCALRFAYFDGASQGALQVVPGASLGDANGALGATLGANARRTEMANSFGIGVLICFSYYSSLKAGQALGWNEVIAPWLGAWIANIFFALLTFTLIWRTHK